LLLIFYNINSILKLDQNMLVGIGIGAALALMIPMMLHKNTSQAGLAKKAHHHKHGSHVDLSTLTSSGVPAGGDTIDSSSGRYHSFP
jgi:hypothetical protein